MKTYRIENTKTKERMVLIVYVVYTIGMAAMAYMQGWAYIVPQIILTGAAASVLFHVREYKNYRFRAIFTACMVWMNFTIYGCYAQNIFGTFSTICAIIILLGIYGIHEMAYLEVGVFVFLLCFHSSAIWRMYVDLTGSERIKMFLQLAAVFLSIYAVRYLVRQQDESNRNLLDTIDNLEKAQQSKNDFMANMSHEIRTPINTVCGISEVVMRERVLSDQTRLDILDIQAAGRQLLSVISNILDFSELEDGKMEIAEEAYNITSTINDVLNIAISKNSKKNLEIIVDCDPTIPCSLMGDEQKIRRVMMNIADNAIKFTNEGGILISVSYREEAYGINLAVSVSDTGIGMNEEELEKLFTSFRQVNAKRNRIEGGIGLGLAITQKIIEKMGGFITVKSAPGTGTIVQFTIPQKVLDKTPIISVDAPETLRVAGYINMEKYHYTLLREGYAATVRHIVENLGFYFIQCRTLSELKRRMEKDRFSHVFVSYEEYCEDTLYFEELSLHRTVVVVLDREDAMNGEPGGGIVPLYKPFYVLPVAAVLNGEQDVQNADGSHRSHRKFIAPNVKILVVDDSVMNLRVAEGLLRPYQIQVFTAESGRAALEKVEKICFDLILMDHMMPEMDGVETLHHIRQLPGQYFKHVPVIALTANAIGGAREMFLSEGFADFVPKPVETSVLERALLRHIPKDKIIGIDETGRAADRQQTPENAQQAAFADPGQEASAADAGRGTSTPDTVQSHPAAESGQEKPTAGSGQEAAPKLTREDIRLNGIDIDMGIGFCGGDLGDYVEVLRIYYTSARTKKKDLQAAYDGKDWKNYTIHAHSIKSMSMNIGAAALSDMAKELEAAGREQKEDFILAHHGEMLAEYERILGIISENSVIFPEKTDADTSGQGLPELKKEQFLAQLEVLGEKLDTFESDGVLEVLDCLSGYQLEGKPIAELLGGIRAKVDAFDFMGAGEDAASIKEGMR